METKVEEFDLLVSEKEPQTKLLEFFPAKPCGYDEKKMPIWYRVCFFCNRKFSIQKMDNIGNMKAHFRDSCPGLVSSSKEDAEEKGEYPFQWVLQHPKLSTQDLLDMKAQECFNNASRFQIFKEELAKRAQAEGLTTPEKKTGNTPKIRKPVSRRARRAVQFNNEELDEADNTNQEVKDEGTTDAPPTINYSSTVEKKFEDLEVKLQTVIEKQFSDIRVQLLSISQQLAVLQGPRSSKKKLEAQKVTGTGAEPKKNQDTLESYKQEGDDDDDQVCH